jgi:PAS domain S-box-containing protein
MYRSQQRYRASAGTERPRGPSPLMGPHRADLVGAAMWRLAGLRRRTAALGSDRPKVLDDALVVVDGLIANLTHALEHAAEVQDRAAASARAAESTTRRYRELYDLIPLPYLRTDHRGTILDVNEPAARLLNLSRQAAVGKALDTFVARDRDTFAARLTELTHQVADWRLQIRPREKHRMWVTAVVRVSTAGDDGEELQWLLTVSPSEAHHRGRGPEMSS